MDPGDFSSHENDVPPPVLRDLRDLKKILLVSDDDNDDDDDVIQVKSKIKLRHLFVQKPISELGLEETPTESRESSLDKIPSDDDTFGNEESETNIPDETNVRDNPEDDEQQREEQQVEPEQFQEEPEQIFEQPEVTQQQEGSPEKKKKVLVDPNATIRDILEDSHYLTSLPVVPEGDTPYTPVLYTFRVKAKGKTTKVKHITTRPPPFYLQFDHTIAVIWTLFNQNGNKDQLGIVQLQWALHFLQSIYNTEGIHPRDVQLCMDKIQDYLIDEYAEMSEESVIYGSATFGDFINKNAQSTNVPFSPNYAQLIEKCPQASAGSPEDLLDQSLLTELENVKKVVGIESIDLNKVASKEQVMNILNEWKKEQIDKIQEELKMLYVVEDMLKNSDSQHFEGYTDESQFESVFRKN